VVFNLSTLLTYLVRAGNVERKLSSIAEILRNPGLATKTEKGNLDLPFVNSKYRARVRVVDMWPMKLWDWSRSLSDPKYGKPGLSAEERMHYKNVFQWNFALLVEDADTPAGKTSDRLMLTMGNEQGQCLLKMNACE
jgi:protection-of-telomeres protein 1